MICQQGLGTPFGVGKGARAADLEYLACWEQQRQAGDNHFIEVFGALAAASDQHQRQRGIKAKGFPGCTDFQVDGFQYGLAHWIADQRGLAGREVAQGIFKGDGDVRCQRAKQTVCQVGRDILLMRHQRDANAASGKASGNGDVAAAGEGNMWPEAAHMADGLRKAQWDTAQVGEGFPGEIPAELARANADEGESSLRNKLGFQAALVAQIEYFGVIGVLKRLSDGQRRIDVPPGAAA